jgi:hypothetical protein
MARRFLSSRAAVIERERKPVLFAGSIAQSKEKAPRTDHETPHACTCRDNAQRGRVFRRHQRLLEHPPPFAVGLAPGNFTFTQSRQSPDRKQQRGACSPRPRASYAPPPATA